MSIKNCPIALCDFKTPSMQFYLRHLSLIHSSESGFCFQCKLNGCKRTFKNMGTYRNHVYSLHTKAHSTLEDTAETTNDGNESSGNSQDNFENGEFCNIISH